MQFIHQPLTWAFFLVLVPLLIHLINMMRHKRVQWAAMEFLLASYKKHRRWVWLKQLILLLLRMLAIAAVVAMLAKLVTDDQFSNLFGKQTTHHYVLLDDSLSMSDRAGGAAAFDLARQAIARIAAAAATGNTPQKITLLRYSRADRVSHVQTEDSKAPDAVDLMAEQISLGLEAKLEEKGRTFDVTKLAVGPSRAVELAGQLIEQSEDDRSVLHVVSDFRSTDWEKPKELRDALGRLSSQGTEIRLIRCAKTPSPNMAITRLETAPGTRAAGVPLFVNVTIRNFSTSPLDNVPLKVRSTFHATTNDGVESAAQSNELPDVMIKRIDAGATISQQFQVFFPTAGQHVVDVSLPADAVDSDNHRWCIVELSQGEPVLIVDGDPEQRAAYYLRSIFEPGNKARTGIVPELQSPNFLRDATVEELNRFRAIYLLNVAQLDGRARDNLRQYVDAGGGLAVFLGKNINASFYTNWYAAGTGLFPVPLEKVVDLPVSEDRDLPDIEFFDHPVFGLLQGEGSAFARSIRIDRYASSPDLWRPPADSTIEVLAELRNRKPLVVQRRFGDGRVMAVLTSLAPDWNNWALEPSFVVVALQLQAYLSDRPDASEELYVGSPLTIQMDAARFRPELTFLTPTQSAATPIQIEMTAEPASSEDSPLLSAVLGVDPVTLASDGQTDNSGIYEVRMRALDGVPSRRRFVRNVNPVESNLDLPNTQRLTEHLQPLKVVVTDADQLLYTSDADTRYSWSEIIFWLLVIILLAEQLLAYSASYHTRRSLTTGAPG